MKNIKETVLVTGPSTNGDMGGQVTHILNIKSTFKGHQSFCVKHFESSSALEGKESVLVKIALLIFRSLKFPFSLFKANIVHINSTFDNKSLLRDLPFMLWSYMFGKRFIVQYHGGRPEQTAFRKSNLLGKVWLWFLKRAERVLVLTEEQLASLSKLGICDLKKVVNYVHCDSSKVEISKPFVFLFLGRIIREKGIFEILDACKGLSKQSEFKVLFYGDGSDREVLSSEIDKLGLSSNVCWLGSVDGEQKTQAFNSANAFILPSYSEGLPYSVLEAMSYGLPVISTDVGSLSQVVKHKETGLIAKVKDPVSLRDNMVSLMADENKYSEYSSAAKELIETRYSNERMKIVFSELWATDSREIN